MKHRQSKAALLFLVLCLVLPGVFAGCGRKGVPAPEAGAESASAAAAETAPEPAAEPAEEPARESTQMELVNGALEEVAGVPGVCYEVLVYSFCDSDGDGIGDLPGLTSRLDYIRDLGCTALWVLPVMPSPTYHKYDVTDYMAIDSKYGTLGDFEALSEGCRSRGMKLILDLPINHTSSEHPWFLEAKAELDKLPSDAEETGDLPFASLYRFRRDPAQGYAPLLTDSGEWFYEARFWEGMPDLNLDSPAVREKITEILSFWLEEGADGFRLDAVTSYYTGDASENTQFLSWLTDTVKGIRPDAFLVGEAWCSQAEYAGYYASGIDALFDFAFAGPDGMIAQVLKGAKSGTAFAEALRAEEELYASYNADFVNAPFYTNHDMARSTGYYAYDDGSKTKLAYAMNFLGTGEAFLYYGEELGMKGSGKDENKRAPMDWGDGEGVCAGPPGMDPVSMKFPSCSEQEQDPYSILNYFRNAVRIRNAYPVIACGRTVPEAQEGKAAAFVRKDDAGKYPSVFIALNPGEETVRVKPSDPSFAVLGGVLTVNGEEVVFSDGELELPGYSLAVLVQEP